MTLVNRTKKNKKPRSNNLKGGTGTIQDREAEEGPEEAGGKEDAAQPTGEPMGVLLFRAIYERDLDEINRLIKDGADINETQAIKGMTPLMFTSGMFYPDTEAFDILLEAGADINIRDKYGNTAIILAANNRLGDCYKVERLLEAGANINDENNKGETPYSVANKEGLHSIKACLMRHLGRCKTGTRRNRKTGKCEPIVNKGGAHKNKPRCTRSRRNKKTRKCVAIAKGGKKM